MGKHWRLNVHYSGTSENMKWVSLRVTVPRLKNPDIDANAMDAMFTASALDIVIIPGHDVEGQTSFAGPREMAMSCESLRPCVREAAFATSLRFRKVDDEVMSKLRMLKGLSGVLVVDRIGDAEANAA